MVTISFREQLQKEIHLWGFRSQTRPKQVQKCQRQAVLRKDKICFQYLFIPEHKKLEKW